MTHVDRAILDALHITEPEKAERITRKETTT